MPYKHKANEENQSLRVTDRMKAMPESTSISSYFEPRAFNSSRNIELMISKQSLNREFQQPFISTSAPIAVVASPASKTSAENSLPDATLVLILNKFVFLLFLSFIIFLNILSLIVFPYIIQAPLTIDD